jgi:hypothetical protein
MGRVGGILTGGILTGVGVGVVCILCGVGCSAILGIGDPTYGDAGTSSGGVGAAGASGAVGPTGASGAVASGSASTAGAGSGIPGPSGETASSGASSGTGATTGNEASAGSSGAGGTGTSSGGASSGSASTGTSAAGSGVGTAGSSGSGGGGATTGGAGIGDPCATATCRSGLTCTGKWCTEACTSSPQCGANSLDKSNGCVLSTTGSRFCFPGCTTQTDCAGFADTQCFLSDGLCANAHGVGDVCSANGNECAPGLECGSVVAELAPPPTGETGWCGNSCAASTQCAGASAGGTNLEGEPNFCIVWNATTDICVPGCSSDADCQNFTGTNCGNWVSDLGRAATCGPASTGVKCTTDASVQGCSGTSTGYSCAAGETPDQADAALTCSAGVAGSRGLTLFCCQ